MPAFIGGLIALLTEFFAKYIGARVAASTAVGLVLIGGWVALQLAVFGLWYALDFTMPATMYPIFSVLAAFLPSNILACMSAIITARLLRWSWDQKADWIKATWTV
jgi:hypothetical protein